MDIWFYMVLSGFIAVSRFWTQPVTYRETMDATCIAWVSGFSAADYWMGTNSWGRGGVYDGGITGITNEILVVESC